MSRPVVFVFCILFLLSCHKKDNIPTPVRVNQLQMIGSHNSYKVAIEPALMDLLEDGGHAQIQALDYAHLPLWEQLNLGLRVLELDIYHDPDGGRFSSPKGWEWLKEKGIEPLPFDQASKWKVPGFKVFHVQDIDFRSHSVLLNDYLEELRTWSILNPGHLPIFITVNAKDKNFPQLGFTEVLPFDTEVFESLDATIAGSLAKGQLFRPSDLRNGYETVEEAVLAHDWPALDEVRGKIIFILDEDGDKLEQYLGMDPHQGKSVMFVNVPEGNPAAAIMIVNDPVQNGQQIKKLVKKGYIVRTRADADTKEARANDTKRRDSAFVSGAQLISSDYYLPDTRWNGSYQVSFENNDYVRINPLFHGEEMDGAADRALSEEVEGVVGLDPRSFLAAEQRLDRILLDVRTDEEVRSGVIKDPLHIDFMKDDFDGKVGELNRNTPVLVYCKVGGRSAKAVEKMKASGFRKVYHLEGGIDAWTGMGYPVEIPR
ncbi:Ca2+-dependent phosphoinositide-specific phospholipase C [Negadavirga shengliensis]|uniref:Ca2+-dependent phosphoinositide-specific phospholipase C n=1 Tax=Negadavirga shengliensis TaxID=1389218 RepID=A0ABV9T170_9BACT